MFADFHIVCNVVFFNEAFKSEPHYSYMFSIGEVLHGDDMPYTFFNGDASTPDEGVPVSGTGCTDLAGLFAGVCKGWRSECGGGSVFRNERPWGAMAPLWEWDRDGAGFQCDI